MDYGTTNKHFFLGVIIPVYNGSKYLEESVQSVLLQPCKDLKVIIVNDGSTDDSFRVAQKLAERDCRVTIVNQVNQGVSAARNTGIEYCLKQGVQYIAFLDADDVWVKNFYTLSLQRQLEAESMDAYQFTYFTGNQNLTRGKRFQVTGQAIKECRAVRFGAHFCSFLYRAEVFSKYIVHFPVGIHVQEDEVFRYIFLTIARELRTIDHAMFIYRSSATSTLHANFDASHRYFEDVLPAWDWAEKELTRLALCCSFIKESDLVGCATMRKTFLSEYIEVACSQGTPCKEIERNIRNSRHGFLYQEGNTVWVDSRSQIRWDFFHRTPTLFWLKHRTIGIIIYLARHIRNFPIIQNIRYKEEISTQIY